MYLQICLWLPMQLFTCMSIWRLELCYVYLGHVFHTDYVVGWPSLQHPLSLLFYILIIILMGVILDVDLSINKYWQWLIINILLDVLKDIYIELLLLLYPWNFCLITGKYNYFCNFSSIPWFDEEVVFNQEIQREEEGSLQKQSQDVFSHHIELQWGGYVLQICTN